MMGPVSVSTSSGRRALGDRAHHRRRAWGLALLACALLAAGSCGFPEYDFDPVPSTGGAGGMSGDGAGGVPQGGGGAGVGGVSGNGGNPGGSGGTEAGSSGSGGSGGSGGQVVDCTTPRVALPATCYDELKGEDETDIDCGGGTCIPCSNRACLVDGDCVTNCVTGTCRVELRIDYQAVNRERLAQQPQFTLQLVYQNGTEDQPVDDFKIRYYLTRGAAFEPILIRSTNGYLNLGGSNLPFEADDVSWRFVKVAASPGDQFDAYVEIQTSVGYSLQEGDYLNIYGEIFSGTGGQFDQETHFSYNVDAINLLESAKIAVFRGDELVWGYEPRGGGQRSCFYRAINLNGGALDIDGENWESGSAAGVTPAGSGLASQSSILTPAVPSTNRAMMLRSSYEISPVNGELIVPVEDGTYYASVFVWSGPTGTETGTLVLEGMNRDTFKSDTVDNGRAWAALGPYLVTVTDQNLNIGVSGTGAVLRVSGLELRTPAAF